MSIRKIIALLGAVFFFLTISANAESWKELLDRSVSFYQSQNFDSAVVSAQKALSLAEKQFGSKDTIVALILHRLGVYYYKTAKFDEAESAYKRSLSIRTEVSGYNNTDVCKTTMNLADLYREQGRYAEAESLGEKALAIAKKIPDPEHQYLGKITFNIATLHHDRGQYTKAESLYNRALRIVADSSASGQSTTGRILRNLANLYCDRGRYNDAEPLYERALAILEKGLSPEHPDVINTLNDFALCYRDQGEYAEADILYFKGQGIAEKVYGPKHFNVGVFLNNRAELYCDWGKYSEAEPLYKRALEILKNSLGPKHPKVATCLNNLALLYWSQGEYPKAEEYYRRSLSIYKESVGATHPFVATLLNDLANLYCEEGKYPEAESLYYSALEITKRVPGSEQSDPQAAQSLMGLADLRGRYHKYDEQRLLYQQAVRIFEKSVSRRHPRVADALEKLSENYRLTKKGSMSLNVGKEAFEIRVNNFQHNGCILSERDALTYSQSMRNSANNYLSCFFDRGSKDTNLVREASEIVFASKGGVSDEIFRRRRSFTTEKDSTVLTLADSLRHTQSQLSTLFVQGPSNNTSGDYRHKLDSLSNIVERLESDLSRKSASFRKQQDYRDVSPSRLSNLLPENSVLLEYLKYEYLQPEPKKSTPRFIAIVLSHEGETLIFDLGEASYIDSLVSEYRRHMLKVSSTGHLPLKSDKEEYQILAWKLYEVLIEPVANHLTGRNLVFIAPDGSLNLISFAGLVNGDGRYLVEDVPIHYVSAARDLIRLQENAMHGQGLFALGDPDYDSKAGIEFSMVGSGWLKPGEPYPGRYRGLSIDTGYLEELTAKPLPNSRQEVEKVAKLWKANGLGSTIVYLGSEATEENLKSKAPGKQAIHLATHGFYLRDRSYSAQGRSELHSNSQFVGENPLLFSGLLLAGANVRGRLADTLSTDDGVLTALEVSSMNLDGTDLVVLSACETALGEVRTGEGVYGLRRAFQMAGVRTVVSALWPVSDKTTAEMMTLLYTSSNKSLAERVRDLQLSQIKKLRSEGFSDHPYNWGAFIALGDWR